MPGLLQFAQHHDPQQIADMQAGGRAIEADIAGEGCRFGERVETGGVGHLVKITARLDLVQELGFAFGHGKAG